MATALKSKPGLTGATALSIPATWDATWFRHFIHNMLKGADVRNAVGANGVVVSGTIASPYATIGIPGGGVTLPAAPPFNSVQFNNGGVFGGSANFTWNGTFPIVLSDGIGFEIQTLTTAGLAYIRLQDQTPSRKLELLYIGTGTGPFYGAAAGDSVINVNSGNFWLSTNDTGRVSISHAGNIVVNAPDSGNTVTIGNVSGSSSLIINVTGLAGGPTAVDVNSSFSGDLVGYQVENTLAGNTHGTFGLVVGNDTNSTLVIGKNSTGSTGRFSNVPAGDLAWILSGGTTPLAIGVATLSGPMQTIYRTTGITHLAPTIMTPATGVALTVNGVNSSFTQFIGAGSGTGTSFGLSLSAGTTAADVNFVCHDATGVTLYFKIFGDGGITVGNPTGGNKGPGTINVASGLFVNGVAVTVP